MERRGLDGVRVFLEEGYERQEVGVHGYLLWYQNPVLLRSVPVGSEKTGFC
jgi:hypothetical protein